MNVRATDIPDLGFQAGDHVCAFYSGGSASLHDIVVDFVSRGLREGNKCVCLIDTPSSVRDRIPGDLMPRDGILQFFTEEEWYLPEGYFSKDTFIRNLETLVKGALSDGYDRVRVAGDASVVARTAVDMKTWFTAESEVNELAPRYPQFLMCLYDLDLFDGEMVMYVLKTHPRIFVNGMIITNPHYIPARQFLGSV
jgi:MEDS: MEthanogen/methylotroph, DcmR Sensory domain